MVSLNSINFVPKFFYLINCIVSYEGRASSRSENEILLVIIKEDKSVICHDLNKGVKPKYYNHSKTLEIKEVENILEIRSISPKGEKLEICGEVYSKNIVENVSERKKIIHQKFGTESDIVDWILNHPEKFGLNKEELEGVEVITGSGRIDLLFKDVLIEVKKRAGVRTFDQIYRYLRERNKKRAFIVCIKGSENLKNAIKKVKRVKLIELEDWQIRENEINTENY